MTLAVLSLSWLVLLEFLKSIAVVVFWACAAVGAIVIVGLSVFAVFLDGMKKRRDA